MCIRDRRERVRERHTYRGRERDFAVYIIHSASLFIRKLVVCVVMNARALVTRLCNRDNGACCRPTRVCQRERNM